MEVKKGYIYNLFLGWVRIENTKDEKDFSFLIAPIWNIMWQFLLLFTRIIVPKVVVIMSKHPAVRNDWRSSLGFFFSSEWHQRPKQI